MQDVWCLRVVSQFGIENTQLKVCFSRNRKLARVYSFEISAQVNYVLLNMSLKEYSSANAPQYHEAVALHCDSLIAQTIWLQLRRKHLILCFASQ